MDYRRSTSHPTGRAHPVTCATGGDYCTAVTLRAANGLDNALANRLSCMNGRAALVDNWRLIQFNKDALQSVVNVTASGGSLGSRDDNLVPLQTMKQRVGDLVMRRVGGEFQGEQVELSQITVEVNDVTQADDVAAAIELLLQKDHDKDDYAAVVPRELLRQAERTRAMFSVLLVVFAGISLIVGGIGIMNIMLATVTERTREIGMRRALGATGKHIIPQFLTETVVLTASGGLLGVLFGLCCGRLFHALRRTILFASPDLRRPVVHTLEPHIAPRSVLLSPGISLGVGLIFSVYPARQAARMDPIETLRHQ